MKRLKSWLLETFLSIENWFRLRYEEWKYKEPERGSVWIPNYYYHESGPTTFEELDPFKVYTVKRANDQYAWVEVVVVDSTTGLLKKQTTKIFKDSLIGSVDFDPTYRRVYESSQSERSIWSKLLRRG
jgi:hypothetical protein